MSAVFVCDACRIPVWENPALFTGLFMMHLGQQWRAQLGQLITYLCLQFSRMSCVSWKLGMRKTVHGTVIIHCG